MILQPLITLPVKDPDHPDKKAKTPPSHLDSSAGKVTEDDRKMCGLMMRIRRVDFARNDTNGTTKVNLVKGNPLLVTGPGLPTYNDLYAELLTTYVKHLTPEGLAILPSNTEDVKNIVERKTIM